MKYPLDNLSPEKFEKLAFYLLDDMGFKNLEWRKGGKGVTATDGGRDLSGKYAKVEPDDTIVIENWWVEVKHRSNTLKKTTVQSLIINSTARKEVDVIAIFTNNTISNSTLDWINEFRDTCSKPRVVVWQKHDIERILRKYPKTASYFFIRSLSLAEQRESIKQAFWNDQIYPPLSDVELFWENFSSLTWEGSEIFPFIIADTAMGGVDNRKWGYIINENLLCEVLLVGLINVPYLLIRSEHLGRNQTPFMRGLEYLLQIALIRLDLDKVVQLLVNIYNYAEIDNPPPTDFNKFILHPIINNVISDLIRNCSKDCMRYGINASENNKLGTTYFRKFMKNIVEPSNETSPFVLISQNDLECKLKLVPTKVECPLGVDVPENLTELTILTRTLGVIQSVLRKRIEAITDCLE